MHSNGSGQRRGKLGALGGGKLQLRWRLRVGRDQMRRRHSWVGFSAEYRQGGDFTRQRQRRELRRQDMHVGQRASSSAARAGIMTHGQTRVSDPEHVGRPVGALAGWRTARGQESGGPGALRRQMRMLYDLQRSVTAQHGFQWRVEVGPGQPLPFGRLAQRKRSAAGYREIVKCGSKLEG